MPSPSPTEYFQDVLHLIQAVRHGHRQALDGATLAQLETETRTRLTAEVLRKATPLDLFATMEV